MKNLYKFNTSFKAVLAFIFIALLSVTSVNAQEKAKTITIKGVVVDKEDGITLPGASVVEKGTVNGAITDIDGNFEIIVKVGATLKTDFMGYKTKTSHVRNKKSVVIELEVNSKILEDVVLIAYGSVKSKDVTGSVQSAKIKNIDNTAATSVDQMLQGRMAGVNIKSAEGSPGQVMDIQIRGANTITGESTPLYIVDGFPVDDPAYTASIDPNDIERIDVLKDASSTAIYGARGANGVVIITTKQGEKGKIKVNFNSKFGVAEIPMERRLPVLDAYEFVRLQNEHGKEDVWGNEDLYRNVDGYNWQNQIFQPGIFQNYNASVSGGTDATKMYLSVGYVEQEGTMIETGFERINARLKLDQKIGKKMRIGTNISYSHQEYIGMKISSSSVSTIRSAITYKPLQPLGYEGIDDPDFGVEEDDLNAAFFNPEKTLKNTDRSEPSDVLQLNTYLEYTPIKSIKLRSTFSYALTNQNVKLFYNEGTNQAMQADGINGSISTNEKKAWINENTVTHTWKTDDHSLTSLVGLSFQKNSIFRTSLKSTNFPFDDWGWNNMELGTVAKIPTSSLIENSLMSSFARVSYSYKGKYLVDASVRADGTSLFPEESRWGFFPSVAVAWRAIEEDFIKDLNIFSNLKVKGGIGSTGNNRIGTWDSFVTYGVGDGGYFDGVYYPGVYQTSLANSSLAWERTNQINLGIDFGFLRDRVILEVEVYQKNTNNLLLDALVPPSAGHETVKENSGSIVNKGIEFSLNTVNIEKPNFTWTTNFNVSFNKNEILSLTEGEELRLYNPGVNDGLKDEKYYGLFVGEAVGQMYGYRYDGLYQVDDFSHNPNTGELVPNEGVPTVETSSGFVAPGMLKYKDLNGDGVINEYDREVIGTPHPISYGGMTNRFTYKNFDLSVLLTFSYGNDIYNGNRSTTGRPLAGVGRNYLAEVANRWTPENPIETGMWSAPVGTNNYLTTYKGKMMSDYWIEDGSYIRISNVALGYNVPKKLLKKAHIKSMKVSAFVDNLYVFTNYSGYDPEVSVKREAMSAGIDYSAYPRPRTYTLSLNLSF